MPVAHVAIGIIRQRPGRNREHFSSFEFLEAAGAPLSAFLCLRGVGFAAVVTENAAEIENRGHGC
jgi:hypothetical protein